MEKPFFSIILPTYNRAHIIKDTIGSVLNQTFTDWELIIVDDGSKDNTREVIESYSDLRIRYQYQKNQERSIARNNGVNASNGKYICFLDSDDRFLPNHLACFYQRIKENNFAKALFVSDFKILREGKEEEVEPSKLDDKKNTLSFILLNSIMPARVCIERSIFDEFNFNPDYIVVEDTILWAEISSKYPLILTHDVSVLYHVHDDNSVNVKYNAFKVRLDGLRYLFQKPTIKPMLNPEVKKNAISTCYYGIARYYHARKEYGKMTTNLLKSIFSDLSSPQNKAKLFLIWSSIRGK
ncbi:MAG: glycosyltransferase family 2 protein [Bacteroidia bacterium]|nr:glycosyltransferase family 2 protein [Bacteroidia bacterium]